LAHQTNHGEQKRITCNYSNHKLSGNIIELTRQRFFPVVHLNFISCFKCCLRRCRLRPLLLFRHFPQSSHIKSFSEAWKDVVNKNVSHVITVTTNCQGISQSSRGRDSSTCSERIISSGLLTFFSGSNDYNTTAARIIGMKH
jgi:hypothetical protein